MDSNGLRFWMLSQLNDWLPPWRANTVYLSGQGIVDPSGNLQVALTAGTSDAGPPATWNAAVGKPTPDAGITWINSGPGAAVDPLLGTWRASAAFAVGQFILDSNGNLERAVAVTGNATTNATPPAWPATLGQTTLDGGITWSCIPVRPVSGASNSGPGTWLPGFAYAAGQSIVDLNGNLQCAAALAGGGKTGAAQPPWPITVGQTAVDGGVTWCCISQKGSWQANTSYGQGQFIQDTNGNLQCVVALPSWQAGTVYDVGQYVQSPAGYAQLLVAVTGNGATGSNPPAWSAMPGQTVADGNATWCCIGKVALPGTTGTAQPAWPTALGQIQIDGTVAWSCAGPNQDGLFYCSGNNTLQLRSVRSGNPPLEDFTTAVKMLAVTPMTLDQYGNYARGDASSGLVMAGGSGPSDAPPPNEVPIFAPGQPEITDLAMGYDGVLYIAAGGSLIMVDQRHRWPNYTLTVADFSFWRLAALPEGGVLALDRSKPQLGKVAGMPLQAGPVDTPDPGVLQPCQANPNPPRMVSRFALPVAETFVAIAPMDMTAQPAQFVVMSWLANSAANQAAYIRIFNETALSGTPLQLGGVRLPYAIAWLGDQKLAALATNLNEALIYDLADAGDKLIPAGETYILSANNVGPMVHGFNSPPNYANAAGASPIMLPLLPLSLNSLAPAGASNPTGPAIIDSGTAQCVWHRMFIEAIVPPRCGALIWLTASDSLGDLFNPAFQWYPHILGAADLNAIPPAMLAGAPTAVWQSIPTEVAFAPTLLKGNPIENTQGLFMVLVQRANKVVRNLSGRYLGVRIHLNGDGRNSPQIAGMRVYGPRFSYVQKYLPAIYREAKFPPAADANGACTRRDFLERFVTLFESQCTRIEDRIANAYLLMRPESAPDDSLDWLGGWIGIKPGGYPPHRKRARIEATPSLYQWRGTAKGVTQALDVATNGACARGAIIVIEDFRLRHIFATILGADLSIQNNPLLPGYSSSGNSIVGDTLFLGDPRMQAELQALYETDLNIPGSAQAVQNFYDQLAFRMTVFVHNQVENVNLNLVRRIVEAEKPAHVQAFVKVATQPFMIGLASLLGVNTYLGPDAPANQVTVGVSDVGRYDIVIEMPSLDPRMNNGWNTAEYARPIARITAPAAVRVGDTIVLDGSGSTAPSGTTITKYVWTLA